MNPDNHNVPDSYQKAWQAQSSQTRVMVDTDLLQKEVQRNQSIFRATILRRDVIEVGIGLLLLPFWLYKGFTSSLPWTWYLAVPAIIFVVAYFLLDRRRHPQKPSEPDEPLLQCVKNSLTQVEHQIWLLRNVFWWYLLPFAISILTFFAHVTWLHSEDWWDVLNGAYLFAFLITLYYFIDWINQRAVDSDLEPRRQELLALLASLGDELTGEVATSNHAEFVKRPKLLRRWFIVAAIACFATLVLMLVPNGIVDSSYPKKSPFAAVRWQLLQPEVNVSDEWYKLVSIDDLPVEEIVTYSRETYADKWQKRFEEDLVELLSRMGRMPQDKVKLEVQSLTTSQTQVLEEIPMTEANRQAIKSAAQARAKQTP